jgi:hypothetical protein
MGFLSKFFGGDAGAPASKPESESPRSAREHDTKAGAGDAAVKPPPTPAADPAAAASSKGPLKEEVTVRDPKGLKELPPAKEAPVAKEATPKAPAAATTKLGAPTALGSTKAGVGAAKGAALSPFSKLGTGLAAKPGPGAAQAATADKPAKAVDKPAVAGDKLAADKLGADKPMLTGAARGAPPERRRALEDSVVTSAPKLPADGAQRGAAAARPPAKLFSKTSPANPPAKVVERGSGDKLGSAASDPSGVPALRPRRDHNKSPGFYSTLSPEHAADAVTAGPFAPVVPKRPSVVGLASAAEPARAPAPARTGSAPVEDLLADDLRPEDLLAEDLRPEDLLVEDPPAEALEAAAQIPPELDLAEESDLLAALVPMATDDAFAPPQPCSTSPGSAAPLAREEKEETSPGLGHTRSRHDPNLSSQLSLSDLELLLSFALDLALGCASEAWFVPLRAAVGRLLAGDAAIRSSALEKALTTLANDLEQPGAFKEENRQRLYGHVVAVDLALSKRMDVTGQKAIRERLIIDQLLEELAQAHPMLTRRLKEQGPVSLEGLGRLSAAELSAKLEAPLETAAQVVSIFQGYLEARVQRGPMVALLGKSSALKERLSALEASAEAFDSASEGDDSGARRRTRKQRQTDVTQLNLLLAEFGEAKTLAEIERCSVQAKIERIQRWIGEQEVSSVRRANKSSSAP